VNAATTDIYTQVSGSGPALVLLHGWGMNATVWQDVAAQLAQRWTVTLMDLPGHGRSPMLEGAPYSLSALATALAAEAPPRAVWVGWSLGGMVAQQLAIEQPQRVAALSLVASTPQFAQSDDWPHGMETHVLAAFAQMLEEDYRTTLQRFLAIQVQGGREAVASLRLLRERLFAHGEPDVAALRGGLALLKASNLRSSVERIVCPIQLLAGRRDALVSADAVAASAALFSRAESTKIDLIDGANHVPFLSHPTEFMQKLTGFLDECA